MKARSVKEYKEEMLNYLIDTNNNKGFFDMFKKCDHPIKKIKLDYIDYPERCLHFKCDCGEKVYLGMDD